jgi:hypothetical protein
MELNMSASPIRRSQRVSQDRENVRLARRLWPDQIGPHRIEELKKLSRNSGLSIASGEILLLDGKWYVTHAGLLQIALRRRCVGIHTVIKNRLCDPAAGRWVFEAIVYKSCVSKGFVGYGDADPSNVSPAVRGSELRIAETRAVNRALRKAYGIGLCSVEELGYVAPSSPRSAPVEKGIAQPASSGNGTGNGQPRLRDRLSLLIRQHQLDPAAVKLFAAEFCGTHELREASREMVESFIAHLAKWASKDRDGLLCKLNSYSTPAEVRP